MKWELLLFIAWLCHAWLFFILYMIEFIEEKSTKLLVNIGYREHALL